MHVAVVGAMLLLSWLLMSAKHASQSLNVIFDNPSVKAVFQCCKPTVFVFQSVNICFHSIAWQAKVAEFPGFWVETDMLNRRTKRKYHDSDSSSSSSSSSSSEGLSDLD